jgi:TPR repeat protein
MFEVDDEEAVELYRRAASAGFGLANAKLASCYELGRGVSKDKQEMSRNFKLAAERGTHTRITAVRCSLVTA